MRNVLLLIVLTVLSFWPCLQADFVYWDDDTHVLNNPAVTMHSRDNIQTIFSSAVNKTYIPLTILTFNAEHYLFGSNPAVYHFNNLLLHLLIIIVIYCLALRLGLDKTSARIGTLVFAVHPMHVESVAWVTQRKDVLYTFFYLLSLLHYWNFLTLQKKDSYYLSLAFAFLSILAKPMALSLPLILLLLDWYHHGRISRQTILNKLPFLLLIVPLAGITYNMNARVLPMTFPESLLTWIWSATFYIKKFFTPFVLLPLYQLPKPVHPFHLSYLSSILLLAAAAFIIYRQRKNRLLIFAVLFYILSTFFLWRYDNTVDVTIVGDRFMYLPSLGVCLWLGCYLAGKIRERNPAWLAAAGIFLVCLMFLTHRQCRIWQNDLSLWEHELTYEYTSTRAYNSYGVALLKDHRPAEALAALNNSIALNPKYALAYYNRGLAMARMNKQENAGDDFTRSLMLNPSHVNSYLERATLLGRQERYMEALNDLEAAHKLDPNNAGIYNNRGVFYKKLNQYDQALANFNRAVELDPGLRAAYVNRAAVWTILNNEANASEDLNRAEKLHKTSRKRSGKSLGK